MMFKEILGVLTLALIVWFFSRMFINAHLSINAWAKQNNYRIISKEFRFIRTGPFWVAKNQPVYRVMVEDGTGVRRYCWIKCGGYGGWNPQKIEVVCE